VSRPPAGVTDIHIHVQPWSQLRPAIQEIIRAHRSDLDLIERAAADPGALVAAMDRSGLRRCGLMNFASAVVGSDEAINDWTVEYIRGHEDRFIAFGCPDLARSGDLAGRIRGLADRGLRGLKIHPPHQGFAPNVYLDEPEHPVAVLYATAQRLNLPVVFHTGTSTFPGARSRLGDPILIDDVAVDFPELTIILAHGGRPLWYETAYFLLRRHPRVYLDISSIPARRIPEVFPRLDSIAGRVLYGSDWPGPGVPGLEESIEAFWACDLAEELKTGILVENSRRLFD
jgi:predicted TIM-barrel fold metal-dependent hydrolase